MKSSPTTEVETVRTRKWMRRLPRSVAQYLLVWLMVAAFLFPAYVMISSAFKTTAEIFSNPPQLLPVVWAVSNFTQAISSMPFGRYLLNSVFIAAFDVLGTLLCCPLVAYSLSALRWRGRGLIFMVLLGTMMLPPQVTLIPVYLIWSKLGLTNSYWPLILPHFLGTPFFIFLLRQFFMNIPEDFMAAARLDGASELRVYWHVVLPLARPALATVGIFQFVWSWTDFFGPLIYISDQRLYTLSLGLYNFFGEHGVEWGPLMAACTMFAIPALVIFVFGQRYFVEGLSVAGLK